MSDSPRPVAALFSEALGFQRMGDVRRAAELYERILALEPRHAPALHLQGVIALQLGDALRACELIERSIEAQPQLAAAHLDLANARRLAGRIDAALASYDRALALKPDLFEAQFNQAVVLQERRRLAEALKGYDRALKLRPAFATAHFNRAVVLADLHRRQDALAAYDCCLELAPRHLEALTNRGVLLLELDRPAEALASFERAIQIHPGAPQAHNNRGNALRRLGRLTEAVAGYERALALEPGYFEALHNRSEALRRLGLTAPALASAEDALAARPDAAAALWSCAELLIECGRPAEAVHHLDRLLEREPEAPFAAGLRLHAQGLGCDWSHFEERAAALSRIIEAGGRADLPFAFLSVSDSARLQGRCARIFAEEQSGTGRPLARRARYRHRRIRLAYVSGDLREHPVSALLVRVLELHDRERFESIGVSFRPAEPTALGRRVQAAFDAFIDVSARSDRAVAELLREREIDIAIDLAGFTQGSRTAILARRPAPVQVNYLGFPGSMGARYIDYILADPFLIPERSVAHYSERVVWMPECFQANDAARALPESVPPRQRYDLPQIGFVFCCLNNTYKIKPAVFDVWMRLLRNVPGSVLWLLDAGAAARDNLCREAERREVNPRRLIFAGRAPYAEHLARLQCADLFLDTVPFNGGATASDALWAGLPLITCAGDAFASRMGGSLLSAAGVPELITTRLDAYESLALDLAHNATRLADVRTRLLAARGRAPLFASERFCRHLETAYTEMWRRSEAGEAPRCFSVPRLP